jgi:hypothetical protein
MAALDVALEGTGSNDLAFEMTRPSRAALETRPKVCQDAKTGQALEAGRGGDKGPGHAGFDDRGRYRGPGLARAAEVKPESFYPVFKNQAGSQKCKNFQI